MSEPFIGEIRVFPFNYAPRGWAQCNGQLLLISSNQALFSIIGLTYGGDGVRTFALPNLQGRTPIAPDASIKLGDAQGEETHVLTFNEMPEHTHQLRGSSRGTTTSAANNVWGAASSVNAYGEEANNRMHPNAIQAAGSSSGHLNMQPYVALNFCIALEGNFPPHP